MKMVRVWERARSRRRPRSPLCASQKDRWTNALACQAKVTRVADNFFRGWTHAVRTMTTTGTIPQRIARSQTCGLGRGHETRVNKEVMDSQGFDLDQREGGRWMYR